MLSVNMSSRSRLQIGGNKLILESRSDAYSDDDEKKHEDKEDTS
jgi:hypothetical protein